MSKLAGKEKKIKNYVTAMRSDSWDT